MRQSVMRGFFPLVALLVLQTFSFVGAVQSEVVEVTKENYTLRFTDGQGSIVLNGFETMQIGTVSLERSPQYFIGVAAEKTGDDTVEVTYKTCEGEECEDGSENATLLAEYTCLTNEPNKIMIHFRLIAHTAVETGGAMFECSPFKGTFKGKLFKSGLWTPDKNGGTSYEVKDGYFYDFTNQDEKIDNKLFLKLPGYSDWSDPDHEHLPFTQVGESNEYISDVEIFILPKKLSTAGAAAAAVAGRDAAVEIATGEPFNLFNPEDDAREFTVKVCNTRDKPLKGELTVVARTLDNNRVVNRKRSISLGSLEASEFAYPLPEAERELYFVEASLLANGIEYFSRTNISILPDYEFKHKDESVLGISDYLPLPDNDSALKFLGRIGVHHLRNGNNNEIPSSLGIVAFAASDVAEDEREISNDLKWAWLGKSLRSFVNKRNNPIWEFGNEWNLVEDPNDLESVANLYGTWVKFARQIIDRNGYPIKMISQGIGGWDLEFLRYLWKNGSYRRLDGIAFHPGRGNVTADAERWNDWNYYGTVKKYLKFVRAHGDKPLYATEVYAGTLPNCYNKDSYRQAAANIVLTLALGVAEGLSSIQVYQLNDGTWYDPLGIDPLDHEYHYGLLMRDLSLKPSAMAYATTAEILDGAKFLKHLNDEADTLRALVFETHTGGKVAILWDRKEGYIQGRDRPDFFHREPWLPTYRGKITHRFDTTKSEVTVVDMIGRKHTVKAQGGVVELDLNGEPIFVYDIDL